MATSSDSCGEPNFGTDITYKITVNTSALSGGVPLTDRIVKGLGTPPFNATIVSGPQCVSVGCTLSNLVSFSVLNVSFSQTFHTLWTATVTSSSNTAEIEYTVRYEADCDTDGQADLIDNYIESGSARAGIRTFMNPLPKCSLSITKTKTPAGPIVFGTPFQYTVVYSNTSTKTITVGTLRDQISVDSPNYGTVPFSYDFTCTSSGSVTPASFNSLGTVQASATYVGEPWRGTAPINRSVTFGPGSSLTCTFNVTVSRPKDDNPVCQGAGTPRLTNYAFMDLTPGINTNLSSTALQPQVFARVDSDLRLCRKVIVTKTANTQNLSPGAPVTFTITVENQGNDPVTALSLSDLVPPGFTAVSASACTPNPSLCFGPFVTGNNVSVNFASLAPLTPLSFTVTANAPTTEGAYKNEAIGAFPVDPNFYFQGPPSFLIGDEQLIVVRPPIPVTGVRGGPCSATIVFAGGSAELGNSLTYTFVSGSTRITFRPPHTSTTFNLPPGTYTVLITGAGATSTTEYKVTVAPCPLSNTGASNCSTLTTGTVDPNWRLAQPFPSASSAATVINPSSPALTFGNAFTTSNIAWSPNSTTSPFSSWINPSATGAAVSGGQYAYRTTFFSGSLTTLNGRYMSDNELFAVYLNGVAQTVTLNNPGTGFTTWTSFSLPITPNTVYTLDFVVRNRGTSGLDSNTTISGLRVEFATVSCPDLMIRDTPVDTGLEPNPDNGPMWISDDIWVRNIANTTDNLCMTNGFMPDGVTRCHQNPRYAGTGFKNKVYVRVTNPNLSGSKTGTVRLYWSKASSGLGWPANWETSTSAGLGGEIPGPTVPSNPVTVPANSSVIVAFDWEPPNPALFGETQSHICLLARIEIPSGILGETSDVNANTRNNAEIAWKNVTVVPDIITGGMNPGVVIVRNIEPTQANIRLGFDVSETGDGKTLLDYGAVEVQLGTELFERWVAGGRAGEGVQLVPPNSIRLTRRGASLSNISMTAGETRSIALTISLTSRPPATKEGTVDINQYSTVNGQEKVVGGVRYALPLVPTSRIVVTAGNAQTAPVNTAFPIPLQAKVTNAAGSPVSGASVTFVAPPSGASGTFNGTATVVTDTSGIATAPGLTANGTAGSYSVLATTTGAPSPASIALTNGNRAAALQISKTAVGSFTRGGTGVYLVTVSNGAGAGPTSGPVGVTDTAPSGLTITGMSGTGWSCSIPTCTRTDVLNAGQSYTPISVTVSVGANATSPQVNTVTVAGGGSAAATASAPTVLTTPGGTFVPAPSVVGLTQAAATTAIQGAGLVLGTVTTATSATVPAGSVISQNPAAGTQVNAGSTISLVVSTGSSPTAGLRFVPLTPCRVMETRALYNFEGRVGAFGPPSLAAAETRVLNLPASNVCNIPNTARAYVVNVTLIPRTTADFATVWPAGDPRPTYWTVRSPDGQIVANSAIVRAGTNAGISIYTSNDADILIDISGYFTEGAGLAFYPMTPCRVIDTRIEYRTPAGPFGPPSMLPGQTRNFRFPQTPYCNVPAATAYSVTLTAVPPGPLAFMTAWPDGGSQPSVSSINSFVGRTLANSIIVPASANGAINVFAFNQTDFLMDINGYFAPDDGQTGQFYFPVTQCRVSDSTVSGGQYPDTSVRTINVPGSGCAGVPANARGYALNFTAIPNGNPMPFLTAYPTGQPQPGASILNAFQGQTVTNSAIIPAGTNGAVDVFAFRRTHVVVEISGYFGR